MPDTLRVSEIPSDPRQLLPYTREEMDELVARGAIPRSAASRLTHVRTDPLAGVRAFCCWPFELMRTSLLARVLMSPLYIVGLIFSAIAGSFASVGTSITHAFFRDPRETYLRDTAKRDGAILDADGNVIGARVPMRASALVILYILTSAEWFIVLCVMWGAWLAARYFLSLGKFPIRAAVRATVWGVFPRIVE